MEELICPACRSRVEVPRAEAHEQYTCRKCHTPFYLNKGGVAVIGKPPDVEQELEELKQRLREGVGRLPKERIVGGLVGGVVVLLAASLLLRPDQPLEAAAERAARALAEGDRGALRSLAASGTGKDAARWFDAVHPRLDQVRRGWFGRPEAVEVHVISVEPDEGRGVVGIDIRPATLGGRDVSLADPTAAAASAAQPFVVETIWTQNWRGRWKLDGRATSEEAPPPG